MSMLNPRPLLVSLFVVVLVCSQQAAATSVLPVSLQRMATAAELIFHGRAISNEVMLDEASGRVATFTTFEIIELVKGEAGPTHTIKQIGGQLPGSNIRQVIHGVPRFTVGEEYVVFLPKASSLGFSSPVGLAQGKFSVLKRNGQSEVSNGRPIAGLMKNTPNEVLNNLPSAVTAERTPLLKGLPDHSTRTLLPDFMQTIRGMTKE
jgi:hypothetical protein